MVNTYKQDIRHVSFLKVLLSWLLLNHIHKRLSYRSIFCYFDSNWLLLSMNYIKYRRPGRGPDTLVVWLLLLIPALHERLSLIFSDLSSACDQ